MLTLQSPTVKCLAKVLHSHGLRNRCGWGPYILYLASGETDVVYWTRRSEWSGRWARVRLAWQTTPDTGAEGMAKGEQRTPLIWREPMVGLCLAWAVGIALGHRVAGPVWVWAVVSVVWLALRRTRVARPALLAAVVCAGAGWTIYRATPAGDDISAYLAESSQLVDLSGRVVREPRINADTPQGMARFKYARPTTSLFLAVDTLHTPDGDIRVSGAVLLSVPEPDTRPRAGDRLRAQGWLRAIPPPANPGERDFRAAMDKLGVRAKLRLNNRGNWQITEQARRPAWPPGLHIDWRAGRRALIDAAQHSLRVGIDEAAQPEAAALLDAMVLGRRSEQLESVYEAYRRTGLAHVLAISGLHVGLLAAGVWFVVQLLTGRPGWAAVAAMVAVGLYLSVVPWRVPILRAAFMTITFCAGLSLRRQLSATSLLALIGLVLLVVRPRDLFEPGFQLSFGIVAALLAFTTGMSRRLLPERIAPATAHGWPAAMRRGADYLAVSIVAWLTALPLVAYHFQMVSPLAVGMSVAALPAVAAVLWLGFIKVLIGLAWPAAGGVLAGPLAWLAQLQVDVVGVVSSWPGVAISVRQPGALLAGIALVWIVLLLAKPFKARRALLIIGSLWLVLLALDWPGDEPTELTVHMLAVGDGSCYVVQSAGEAWLFDCGSSNYAEIGRYAIVPALRSMGVGRVDTLVISHADYDHFSGALDIVDHISVDRIVTTQHVLDDAADSPRQATAYLVDGLRRRGVAIERIARGWRDTLGEQPVEALWPPAGRTFEQNNDSSIVLAFEAAGRRLLLTGDIAEQAMAAMRTEGIALAADVTDLPHHGSFPPGAVEWLHAVGPSVVLQSSGPRRLDWDKWAPHLGDIDRWVTARSGAVRLTIDSGGNIAVTAMRERR